MTFDALLKQYRENKRRYIAWDRIKDLPDGYFIRYEKLPAPRSPPKVLPVKLNGGLGTTMKCTGPKCAMTVRNNKTFLELTAEQLKNSFGAKPVLCLMNSFNTEKYTNEVVKTLDIEAHLFTQSKYRRIYPNGTPVNTYDAYYPPGHGDFYAAFVDSGMCKWALSQGYEYVFVSNIDNVVAVPDPRIAEYLKDNNIDFCLEMAERTSDDSKGGTLVNVDGKAKLLEVAEVPPEKLSHFMDVSRFRFFNTNNTWIRIASIEPLLPKLRNLTIIVNKKNLANNSPCVQLETAMGDAVRVFEKSVAIIVERCRFVPVKKTTDLFKVQSDLFEYSNNVFKLYNKHCKLPPVSFCKYYQSVEHYCKDFKNVPSLKELKSLKMTCRVKFGRNVVLKGEVELCGDENTVIHVPDNTVLNNVRVTRDRTMPLRRNTI